jgi:hypothetical protein
VSENRCHGATPGGFRPIRAACTFEFPAFRGGIARILVETQGCSHCGAVARNWHGGRGLCCHSSAPYAALMPKIRTDRDGSCMRGRRTLASPGRSHVRETLTLPTSFATFRVGGDPRRASTQCVQRRRLEFRCAIALRAPMPAIATRIAATATSQKQGEERPDVEFRRADCWVQRAVGDDPVVAQRGITPTRA